MSQFQKAPKQDPKLTLNEIKGLMHFLKSTQPTLQGTRLAKISGFKIKGLQGTFKVKRGDHCLLWSDYLNMGICQCEQWRSEKGWSERETTKQHAFHRRKEYHARLT